MGTPDDVAIIGIACTFAGAPDLSTYWSNILNKVDCTRDAPPGWIGNDAIYDPAAGPNEQRIYTRRGGFLGELSRFDPRPFGTMPVALGGSEPDQFLALRASMDALADAGYGDRDFDRHRTGIILGHGIHPHRANVNGMQHCIAVEQTVGMLRSAFPELADHRCAELAALIRAKLPAFNVDTLPGLVPNMMTGRIANRLDLMGPNFIVDGACASSTLALDAAVTELRLGRADMMLAGGINTSTSVLVQIVFCKIGALSGREKCRPFDASADGTLLGEGQGVVVLKRLADAMRDGDRIYAVIKGMGTASDGRAMGLMAPRFEGEQLAMQRAYANSGIDPATVGLIEAHATGIPLGDDVEIRALTSVFGERQGVAPTVAIGSVKSMIGHCIPAAGMASVIKMSMALHRKVLPPTLADACNPALGFERTPFFLNTDALPWIHAHGTPRRAALDAFGFGGINTHMILEEAPGTGAAPSAAFGLRHPPGAELFMIAAETRAGLLAAARDLAARAAQTDQPMRYLAADSARTLGSGDFRLAVVATDSASLSNKLEGVLDKLARDDTKLLRSRKGIFFSAEKIGGKLAFIFPGENSQSAHMLRELAITSPIVRNWLDWLDGVFADERDIPHRSVLFPPALGVSEEQKAALDARLHEVDYGSESVFVADMALYTLLHALGIRPDFMAGHSTGENAAIFASGLMRVTPEELADIVRRMNAIFRGIQTSDGVPSGTLLTVGAIARPVIDALLAQHPDIHLTMDNCPNQVILFGPPPLMDDVAAKLAKERAICTVLPLSWAYHTKYVAPMAVAFGTVMDGHFGEPNAQLYSCATAAPLPDTLPAIRETLRQQYISRVRFSETVERMYDDGARIFVEVGPGSILTGFVDDILRDKPHLALSADSRRAPGLEHLLGVLAQLFVNQVPFDASVLHAANGPPPPPPAKQPFLESALPYVHLNGEESARFRDILTSAIPALASDAAPAVAPQPEAPTPAERSEHVVMSEHFDLMRAFLRSQHTVSSIAIGADSQVDAPIAVWSGSLDLPFAAAVEFVAFDVSAERVASFAALVSMLSASDRVYFDRELSASGPFRQLEWLLGRAAARRALSAWFSSTGNRDGMDADISYDAEGQPTLSVPGVFLSVSHKQTVAVATVSDRPVGIDLEQFTAVHDPAGIVRIAFSVAEEELLAEAGWAGSELIAIAWSAKEATAKALGQKLLGRERSLAIMALDLERATMRIAHADGWADVFYAVDGNYVCTLALPARAVASQALNAAEAGRI